ncbi:AmpG family muropeptide MFS transporter [Vineibacter terrae]|uniref:AmpG family muropeptide MFS transporter n=1 Tax=Vineibacter terrae TaxID=2586908 RepID=UPI002E37B59E|nr:MFS transporter [Vineibacter terrae]HEX2892011.1 MFS transporter [Vineibacter terrae]
MSEPATSDKKQGWVDAALAYRHGSVRAALFLGFSSGLPLLLVFGTLSARLRETGVDRTTIGFISWVALTYAWKFAWAPLVDRLPLPPFTTWLGRRRGWMLVAQSAIVGGLLLMAGFDPRSELQPLVIAAVVVAFASATQDIAVDAWRIEATGPELQGPTAGAYQLGYRIAVLAAGAGALYLAELYSWRTAYLAMAALGLVGVMATLLIREPAPVAPAGDAPLLAGKSDSMTARVAAWFTAAVVGPFADYFRRMGWVGVAILAFIGLFRISDITLGVMANPFYIDMGFSKADIATVTKVYGFWMSIGGALAGGAIVVRYGIRGPLIWMAMLLPLTNLLFALLAARGRPDVWLLAMTISADNFVTGISGSVFIAYLSSLTNTAYTATQYALFSSLMLLPGKFLGGWSGAIVDWAQLHGWSLPVLGDLLAFVARAPEQQGYVLFFLYTTAIGLPTVLLAIWLTRRDLSPGSPDAVPASSDQRAPGARSQGSAAS